MQASPPYPGLVMGPAARPPRRTLQAPANQNFISDHQIPSAPNIEQAYDPTTWGWADLQKSAGPCFLGKGRPGNQPVAVGDAHRLILGWTRARRAPDISHC